MKDSKSVWLYTSTGYPFTAYGKRGHTMTLIEWEWDDAWVRMSLAEVAKNPDVALGLAASKVLGRRS